MGEFRTCLKVPELEAAGFTFNYLHSGHGTPSGAGLIVRYVVVACNAARFNSNRAAGFHLIRTGFKRYRYP